MMNLHDENMIRKGIDQDSILSAIAEGTSDAITKVNAEGIMLSWSPGAERMFGFSPDEIVGRPVDLILPPEIRDRERERIALQMAGDMGLIHEETVRLRKNGERVHVQMTRLPLQNPRGETVALLAVLKDITEEKKLKRKVETLERDTAMAKVAAKVAHEIRTPLGVLFLKSDLLDERLHMLFENSENPEILKHRDALSKYIHDIQKQVSRLEEIANNYLHLSKSRSMDREEIELKPFLREIHAEMREQYRDEGISWPVEIKEPLPGVFIDPKQFHRVFTNLVRNSIEAVRGVERDDKMIGFKAESDGRSVHFVVWDNGPGMPNEIKQTVFDPFTTTKSIGTGLGLYLVQEIIQNHGGGICIESGEGEGTSVHFCIPASCSEEMAAE